jgi:hypothetical protein
LENKVKTNSFKKCPPPRNRKLFSGTVIVLAISLAILNYIFMPVNPMVSVYQKPGSHQIMNPMSSIIMQFTNTEVLLNLMGVLLFLFEVI